MPARSRCHDHRMRYLAAISPTDGVCHTLRSLGLRETSQGRVASFRRLQPRCLRCVEHAKHSRPNTVLRGTTTPTSNRPFSGPIFSNLRAC
ncbi:MAG: hypothetical protein ACK559_05845, partial [bacterium]